MISLRRKQVLIAGTLLILGTNAIALGGAIYNRSGQPESTLKLSERELYPPHSWRSNDENNGLSLHLNWRVLSYGLDDDFEDDSLYFYGHRTPGWLDASKLAALGFDVSVAPDAPEADLHFRKQLSRDVALVLELAGRSYESAVKGAKHHLARAEKASAVDGDNKKLKENLESAQERLAREETSNSRLFVVDAGPDQRQLRERYPDTSRYAIVRGQVGISTCTEKKSQRLCGQVEGVSISDINVPLPFHRVFEGTELTTPTSDKQGPRFEVVVAFGLRLEPWILSAERSK